MDQLKIGIVGAGAIGGVLGAILSKKNYDVEITKRYKSGIQLDNYTAINISGMFGECTTLVKSVNGINNFTSDKDIIFIFTRAYDAPQVAEQCLKHLTPNGIIVSLQNVMNLEEMISVVGNEKLFALIVNWSSKKITNTQLVVTKSGNFVIGGFSENSSQYLQLLKRILDNVSPTIISSDIVGDIWCRTIINSCISSVGAITGVKLGKFMVAPNTHKIFTNIIREAMTLANAIGVKVKNYGSLNYYEITKRGFWPYLRRRRMFNIMLKQNAGFVSSSQRAIENNVKSEIDYLNGYFVRLGKKLGIPVPTNKRVYDMVKEIENGERPMTLENLLDYYLRNSNKYQKYNAKKKVEVTVDN